MDAAHERGDFVRAIDGRGGVAGVFAHCAGTGK